MSQLLPAWLLEGGSHLQPHVCSAATTSSHLGRQPTSQAPCARSAHTPVRAQLTPVCAHTHARSSHTRVCSHPCVCSQRQVMGLSSPLCPCQPPVQLPEGDGPARLTQCDTQATVLRDQTWEMGRHFSRDLHRPLRRRDACEDNRFSFPSGTNSGASLGLLGSLGLSSRAI